jgi:hypothetical protein
MPKIQLSLTALLLSALFTCPAAIAGEAEHSHSHHDEKSPVHMVLNQGKKWQIDSSLHTGMNRIKTTIETNLNAIHHDNFTNEQYINLASEVNNHLNYLFKNCALPSDADAQLHLLLFPIMQATEQMSSSNNARQGAIKVIKALQKYPKFFHDEQWQTLEH